MAIEETAANNEQCNSDDVQVDSSGRSSKPPKDMFFVVWGHTRLQESQIYRGRGHALRRAAAKSATGHFVRVYQANVTWVDVTDKYPDRVDQDEANRRLQWAGDNPIRRHFLAESGSGRPWLMKHHKVDRVAGRLHDLLRRPRA